MSQSIPNTETGIASTDLIAAVRALGSDARDLRDAAHEASHALELRVPRGKWDRVTIDRYAQRRKMGRGDISSEVLARAVEQIVCERLGTQTKPVEHWACVAAMESVKFDRVNFDPGVFAKAVRDVMGSARAAKMADAVIALARPARARKTKL